MKLREPYTQEKKVIDKNSIKEFLRPKWHREFRTTHLATIKNGLKKGNHFSESLTINEVGGKLRVMNGNHRLQAVAQLLKTEPDFAIEVRLTKYKNLDYRKEIDIYTIINRVKPESSLDKIKAKTINSFFVKNLDRFSMKLLFRSRARCDANAIPINLAISPFIMKNDPMFTLRNNLAVKNINEFEEQQLLCVKDYLDFFVECFGEFNSANNYTKPNFFTALGKLYYNNVNVKITKADFAKKMELLKKRYTSDIIQLSQGGFDKREDLYYFIMRRIKGNKKLIDVLAD